jgi:hypothetical protein
VLTGHAELLQFLYDAGIGSKNSEGCGMIKPKLEQETAVQFAQAGDNWDLTIDEINFIFSLGMTLATHINKKENDNGTDEQN